MTVFKPDLLNIEEEHYSFVTWQCLQVASRLQIPALFYTWQNIDKNYPWPFSSIEKHVLKNACGAAAGNQEAAHILRRKGFSGQLKVIPQMGAGCQIQKRDKGQKLRKRLGLATSDFIVSFVGRLVAEKGVQTLLEAAVTETRCVVLVIGQGPFEEKLRHLAQEYKISSRVHFLGQFDSDDVSEIMAESDVLCLPSLTMKNWKEQFGRVLPEAMSVGTVPVGSSSGEIPEVIGESGLVFKEGSAVDLSLKLGKLIAEPGLYKTLQQNGYERFTEHFTHEVVGNKFGELFSSVLGIPRN